MAFRRNIISLFLVGFIFFIYSSSAQNLVYNVQQFGATANGESDSTASFLSAWAAACASPEVATIYVPPGEYLLGSVTFDGQICQSSAITIRIDGTIMAPSDYNVIGHSDSWLKFDRVNGVSIVGGTIDGQGSLLWTCKTSGKHCPHGATLLAFYNSNNIVIDGLTSINSQMFHILIEGCHAATLQGLKVSAPGDSPNTDGIHVKSSSYVAILSTQIGTGDDCISIGPGNSNLLIENIACGPGHGISIGSLGWELDEEGVQNVTVRSVTFTGTENGVRLKTWARPSNGFVRSVIFQHLAMVNVENPIIIDQNYCPNHKKCPTQGSGVQISDITYQDIHGTSATEVAIKIDCSKTNPCSLIKMEDVKLTYRDGYALTSYENARVDAYGTTEPSGGNGFGTTEPSGGNGFGTTEPYGGYGFGTTEPSGPGLVQYSVAAPSNLWVPSITGCSNILIRVLRITIITLVIVNITYKVTV